MLAAIVSVTLIAVASYPPEDATRRDILIMTPFLGFGLYGPVYLVLTHIAFRDLGGDRLRARLRETGSPGILTKFLLQGGGPKTWAIGIAVVALASVSTMLVDEALRSNGLLVVSGVLAIAGSWVLLSSVFAVEYARAWAQDGSFAFPGEGERVFFDFLYLAFQVSSTFSSSDVQVVSRRGRGMVTAHSIVAFAYSTVIVAVFVSMLLTIAIR